MQIFKFFFFQENSSHLLSTSNRFFKKLECFVSAKDKLQHFLLDFCILDIILYSLSIIFPFIWRFFQIELQLYTVAFCFPIQAFSYANFIELMHIYFQNALYFHIHFQSQRMN